MKGFAQRPKTVREVAKQSSSLEEFGLLLREWIHEVTRGDISNRPALKRAIDEVPRKLKNKFKEGEERVNWVRDCVRKSIWKISVRPS